MRILQVASEPPTSRSGGAEKICSELSQILEERGHDVKLLTSSNSDFGVNNLHKSNSKLARKLFFDYYNPINSKILNRCIKEFRPEIVHFHNLYGIGSSLVKTSIKSRPTVITVHDYWPFCYRSTMTVNGRICAMNCRNCHFPIASISRIIRKKHIGGIHLIAPSKNMESSLLKAGFNNVTQIYNGVRIPNNPSEHTDYYRILFAGRLVEEKGLMTLIDAVTDEEIRLDIFGDGPLRDSIIKRIGNNNLIKMHGHVNLEPEYKKGGVLVLPSICPDNLPTVLLEAMSFGLPLVASNIGGIKEIIQDGFNGYLIPPGDVSELKMKLHTALNRNNYQELSMGSRTIVNERFSWKCCAEKHEKLYLEQINRYKVNRP